MQRVASRNVGKPIGSIAVDASDVKVRAVFDQILDDSCVEHVPVGANGRHTDGYFAVQWKATFLCQKSFKTRCVQSDDISARLA